jgi:glyoxylase-like metal-dependent hydrolase (beta-lactamase superfamily II)
MTTQIQPLAGTVVTLENDAARTHTYSAPEDSFLVNSHVIETEHALVVLDGQLMRGYAAEFAGYVESLGKPVDRLILSHVHPDHFAGLPVILDRFPGTEIHALAQVKQYLDANAAVMLENRAGVLGDALDGRAPVISKVLPVGEEVIDGLTYRFAHLHDAESQHSLLIELPQLGTTVPVDVVFRNEFHLFTVGPFFDPWTEVLGGLRDRLGSAERLLVGHGAPTDPSEIDGNIAYLAEAKAIHAQAADHEQYAEQLKAAFPERSQGAWVDFSGLLLYGLINP